MHLALLRWLGPDEASAKRHMTIEEIQDEHPDFFYYL